MKNKCFPGKSAFFVLISAAMYLTSSCEFAQDSNKEQSPIISDNQQQKFINEFAQCYKANVSFLEKTIKSGEDNNFTQERFLYAESYPIRGLNVAYDITGKKEYLDVCKKWSDQQLRYQEMMHPTGAYYMGYQRIPGAEEGDWYTADCSSIALGVLATAVRCEDTATKQKYINSVKSFAKLVKDNFIGSAGGITDGYWDYDVEWWCSSGLYGSLLFQLYKTTGEKQYLETGLEVIDWLNLMKMEKIKYFGMKDYAPTVVLYTYEAYSSALPYLKVGSVRRKKALAKIGEAVDWMLRHQAGNGSPTGKGSWYENYWGQKMGGLPFHMYVWARYIPEYQYLIPIADKEMAYLKKLTTENGKAFYIDADNISINASTIEELSEAFSKNPLKPQISLFMMMSYAEKISPGSIYR